MDLTGCRANTASDRDEGLQHDLAALVGPHDRGGLHARRHRHHGRRPLHVPTWVQLQEKLVSGTSIKTINGQSVLGSGNLVLEADPRQFSLITSNTTLTVPANVSTVRFYAGGKGGDGGFYNGTGAIPGGGGGGFAFGDLAVSPGDTVAIKFTSGITRVLLNGTVVGTANAGVAGGSGGTGAPATRPGGLGGTASISGAVTNGGAYSGGRGGSALGVNSGAAGAGGASCGSPLGDGFPGGAAAGLSGAYVASGRGRDRRGRLRYIWLADHSRRRRGW